MKTIFDKTTRDQLVARIALLTDDNKAQWGKMNVYQMVKHCRLFEEMILGKTTYKRAFIGRLFGKLALRNVMSEGPLAHNTPSLPELIIKDNGQIAVEKERWVALIEEHGHSSGVTIIHPFFGRMTREQVGIMAYKHTDHHLRQFNV
ncbi:DUF1569 domain-containing protein [Puia dinghuensis]|uniref:DUF1569 domain-containing protein n=1 Tax=Puia dinghuensis TaxID=1792502 RepID=A0A8J2UI24_9BACT|nr:DUF1569 domain-containing protein [Puia dinghuensis]GGB20416.1 hypothetical protein GCM10011511_50180 [Puia dinghuensis]